MSIIAMLLAGVMFATSATTDIVTAPPTTVVTSYAIDKETDRFVPTDESYTISSIQGEDGNVLWSVNDLGKCLGLDMSDWGESQSKFSFNYPDGKREGAVCYVFSDADGIRHELVGRLISNGKCVCMMGEFRYEVQNNELYLSAAAINKIYPTVYADDLNLSFYFHDSMKKCKTLTDEQTWRIQDALWQLFWKDTEHYDLVTNNTRSFRCVQKSGSNKPAAAYVIVGPETVVPDINIVKSTFSKETDTRVFASILVHEATHITDPLGAGESNSVPAEILCQLRLGVPDVIVYHHIKSHLVDPDYTAGAKTAEEIYYAYRRGEIR